MNDTNEISACETCGSLVIKHRSATATSYYIPISEDNIMAILTSHRDVDLFVLDRLQRAERIIEDLRKQLREKKG